LTFVLPQIPGLLHDRFISHSSLAKTLFLACLTLAMCGLGWTMGTSSRGRRDDHFNEMRLLHAAAALSLVGAYFFYKFGQLPDEERLRGMLTGTAVAYLFFARLLTYGFAIAILCLARRYSNFALCILLLDGAFYFERVVIAGRRQDAAEFFLIIALAFWFQRRWAVPRPAVLLGLAVIVAGLLGAGEYRQATYYGNKTDWSAVMNIDLSQNWDRLMREGGGEMRNAVNVVDHIEETKNFDFGLSHWNNIVFSYIPAQLIGQQFKESLMFDLPDVFDVNYTLPFVGSTLTGFSDCFSSFWYFGSLEFFLIALIMGRIYIFALRGSMTMQVFYMLSLVPSMLTITHSTHEIVGAWIHMLLFLALVPWYAAVRPRKKATDPLGRISEDRAPHAKLTQLGQSPLPSSQR
jgi:hypothetical protein